MMHHGGPHDDDDPEHAHHSVNAGAADPHGHSHESSGAAVDLSLGRNGEWADKVDTAREINSNTGGNVLFLTPGLKLTSDNWAEYINAGIPIARDINGIQSDPDWRIMTGASVKF